MRLADHRRTSVADLSPVRTTATGSSGRPALLDVDRFSVGPPRVLLELRLLLQ